MKLVARVAVLALALAPIGAIAAFGDSSPQIEMATPGVGDGAIERFTVRFNQLMVPLGDPRAESPFDVKCPIEGTGRWIDQRRSLADHGHVGLALLRLAAGCEQKRRSYDGAAKERRGH